MGNPWNLNSISSHPVKFAYCLDYQGIHTLMYGIPMKPMLLKTATVKSIP